MEENTVTATIPPLPPPPPSSTSNHDTNAKTVANPSRTREEGEISASENDDFAGSQFPGSTILPAAPLNKNTNSVDNGVSAPTHNPTYTTVASRTTVHSNNRKGAEKNRVPFVISFSDDDSGSDSEEYMKGNTIGSDEMTRGVVENRKLSTSFGKLQMAQQSAKTNTRMPKNLPTNRTFVSSMNRVNGTKSKNGGNTFVGVKNHLKKSNPPSIIKFGQNVHINSSKLQDLRQLIAIRENELKSKAGKLDKEVASSSYKNNTNMNLKSNTVRNKDSTERVLVEPKEPEKKRLKVSEPPTNTQISVGQHNGPSSESTSAVKISSLESDGLKSRDNGSYPDKEIQGGSGQSSVMQQIQELKNHNILSTNLPSGTTRRHNRITNLTESSVPLMATTDKTSPPTQGSLKNSSFWDHFGATNIPTTGEMDIKSLMEIEELQDKELDEAQEHRRKCEIEERNALKAYRKAQRALAEANTRCSYLYHKRELFSANLRSHVMEDSGLFWSNMPHQHTGANVHSITNMSEDNLRSTDTILENGRRLASESCSEPDTSGSEPQEEEKTNDVCSSLHENNNNNNNLGEDEQTSAFELKAGDSSLDSHGEGICSERTKEINNDSVTISTNEDSLLLEATLRSQLFARLGIKKSKKIESGQSTGPAVEREDGEIMEDVGNIPSSETEKDRLHALRDIEMSEKSITEQPMGIKDQGNAEKHSVNYGYLAEPIVRSAFGHVKLTAVVNSDDLFGERKVDDGVCGARPTDLVSDSNTCSLLDIYVGEVGSYSNNLAISPFWPLCMFELRGKCNDDECPWQHVRDYSSRSINSNSNDNIAGSSLQRGNDSLCLAPPTYLVCLDSLKSDSYPYEYLVAQTVEQRWQKYFSASLVVSSSILADLLSDEPCLHGSETRIEVRGVWNRQSSYFRGTNVKEGPADQDMDDTYQQLEIALTNLSREVNKQKGRREALIVLARALEAHPTSVLLWIVYLHIYYSNQKSIGKDDLFRYAIENNESSYELWLMFINSREKLDDRLLGYNTAISALCRHASTLDRDLDFDSECILDLFLQMINCLCSSGEVDNAIQKVYSLLSSTKRSIHLLAPQSLPDIDNSLTIPDKCVLWVCSIYLVMYKKLPDTIVQQFECQKELSAIEWHSVHLTPDQKLQALTLMELADEYIDSKQILKSTQLFALNYIKCTAVLKGPDSCKDLLKKYIQLYPSSLELILLSIRVNGCESMDAAFEEALSNWVPEYDGIQCIWNQYAEYALQNGRNDFAKEMMERWFSSVSEFHHPTTQIENINSWISSLTQTDIVFGLLNLSLHKQLQNNRTEASLAIKQVLEVASSEDYNHCVREHASFFLKNGFGKARLNSFLNILNRYLMDSRALPPPEPLSRSFIKNIRKQKTQKIVNNLLCPISSDSSLLNLVLESCFGKSLLPFKASEELTDVVDFAEALMGVRPANYRLALCICKNQSDANASISFWASAQLINSLFQAVPVAPESVWVEAADLLKTVAGFESILEGFHKRALSVYPFSMRLWKSYLGLYANDTNKANAVIVMAGEKGIKL